MDWSAQLAPLENFYQHWPHVVYLGVIIVAAFVVNRILRWVLAIVTRHHEPAEHIWVHAFLDTLSRPLRTLIWLVAASIVAHVFLAHGDSDALATYVVPARNVLVNVLVAWYLLRVTDAVQSNMRARATARGETLDKTLSDAVGKVVRACVCIFLVLAIMQIFGVPLSGLLAFGGAAGIAVGFAAQSLVANLLGGATIYASKIFRIDETIILPGTDLAGTVKRIGWRSTHVLGWDGRPVYIPNALFNTTNLVNHSRLERREFSEDILLRYKDYDKVQAVVDRAKAMLAERNDINFFSFGFDAFGDAALKLHVYAWPQNTAGPTYLPYAEFVGIKQDVLMAIADIAIDEGCELVQPFSHVYLRTNGTSDRAESPAPDTP